jgi:hypothetical protein
MKKNEANDIPAVVIPELFVLEFMESLRDMPATWLENNGELFVNSVQYGMPHGVTPADALAKMDKMIRKGLVTGCSCGCPGNFVITDQGRDEIAQFWARPLTE